MLICVCVYVLRPSLQAEWGLFARNTEDYSQERKTNRTLRTACRDVPWILWKAAMLGAGVGW